MHNEDLKKDRYKEANNRIDRAISSGFSFEAIAISESILSDRISSFLRSIGAINGSTIDRLSFSQLITLWRVAVINPGSIWEECTELINKVDDWRKKRNKYIHGLVKFPHNKVKIETTKEFLDGAKNSAIYGKQLSIEVSEWRGRQIAIKTKASRSTKA